MSDGVYSARVEDEQNRVRCSCGCDGERIVDTQPVVIKPTRRNEPSDCPMCEGTGKRPPSNCWCSYCLGTGILNAGRLPESGVV